MMRFVLLLLISSFYVESAFAQPQAPATAPVCGIRFLNDFKKHYGFFECLSRGDKLCISERVNEKSTTAYASMSGAAGAAAGKVASSKMLSAFVKEGAKTVGSKIAWGAVAGGAYFITTKLVGGVVGFFADTVDAGDCRDSHPWILYLPVKGICKVAYRLTDNRVAANFFNLDNEALQLDTLKDPMACDYFYKLHLLLKAEGEKAAVSHGVQTLGLFDDSSAAAEVQAGAALKTVKPPTPQAGGVR